MKLKPRHPLPMVLFGLPFFIAGIVVLILGFLSLYNTIQAQSWEKVPVTILKLEIKTHEGDDGNTYSIDTEYQYTYQNQPYHGHRFSFSMGNDSVSDHTTLIQVVKSRDPAYGFVNPNQPSESVLVKEISPMVGLMVPFGMVFLLVGVGVMSGSMTGTTVSPNEVQSYLPDGKIVADNSRSKLALFLLPILSCFFMVFINAIFLLKWTGPANTFYITLGVIGLGFWGGWYLSHRSYTEADIRIDTPPGNLQPFAFSLQLKEEPATVPITNTFPTNPNTAKLTIFVSEGSGEDKKEHELLSAGFNTTAVTPF